MSSLAIPLAVMLALLLPGAAAAQGSPSLCARQPGYIGCLPVAPALSRTNTIPLAVGDNARSASIAQVLGQLQATDIGAFAATGGTVSRTLAARAADVMQGADHGVVCDGVTDAAPAITAMLSKIGPGKTAIVQLPPGVCAIGTLVTWTNAAIMRGHGGGPEGTPGTIGTWLKITAPTAGFRLEGSSVRGAVVRDLGVMQTHPASGAGWAPTAYGFVFTVANTYGSVLFDNIMFAGVNKGIFATNSGRLRIGTVFGQFYTTGLDMNALYDVSRIDHFHCWPFQDQNADIIRYQMSNADCVVSRRVDGLVIGDLFTFGMRSAIHFVTGSDGPTSAFQISNLYSDLSKYGAWFTGDNASGQFSNIVTTHASFPDLPAAVRIPGSAAILVDGSNTLLGINQLRTERVESSAVQMLGSNNRMNIDQSLIRFGWNAKNDGSAAFFTAASVNGVNILHLGSPPVIEGAAPGPVTKSLGASGITQPMRINTATASVNEPRAFSAAAGNGVVVAAIGTDASIDMAVGAKGPAGSVLLNAGTSSVMRLDNPGTAGTATLLVRSLITGTLLLPESPNADTNLVLNPKGGGSVIATGAVITNQGVCLTTDCAMRVRSNGDGTRMLFVVGNTTAASLDFLGTLRTAGAVIPSTTP